MIKGKLLATVDWILDSGINRDMMIHLFIKQNDWLWALFLTSMNQAIGSRTARTATGVTSRVRELWCRDPKVSGFQDSSVYVRRDDRQHACYKLMTNRFRIAGSNLQFDPLLHWPVGSCWVRIGSISSRCFAIGSIGVNGYDWLLLTVDVFRWFYSWVNGTILCIHEFQFPRHDDDEVWIELLWALF